MPLAICPAKKAARPSMPGRKRAGASIRIARPLYDTSERDQRHQYARTTIPCIQAAIRQKYRSRAIPLACVFSRYFFNFYVEKGIIDRTEAKMGSRGSIMPRGVRP